MPARPIRTKRLTPRRAFLVVECDVEADAAPDTCCIDASGNYAECDAHRRERLEDQDALDAHLALARNS